MKSLNNILNVLPEECSDEDLENSILEGAESGTPSEIEKPADADKVTVAMANLSDMVTMADEIYYTLSDLEEIEEEMVGKIEMIFTSLDELYKEVDETYDIAVPEMGPSKVEEAEEIIGRSLDSILNEARCTSGATKLEEMKTKDDDLAVMIYDFIGADTEGLPLKTLIHQAVGKYFGSQKEKKEEAEMYEGGDLQEAIKMSQGVTTATRQIYSLENSLKVGSNLNKGINRSLQGKYDADFKEMEKSIGTIINVWGEIERDFSDPDMYEARVTSTSTSYSRYDATTELMLVVNSLVDQKKLRTKWDYDIDEKGPVSIEGSSFPLHKSATLKIFNVRGEDPFTVEQKNYLMDVYKQSQKGSAFGRGSKWHKMEFSKDSMEATAKIDIQPKEILDKN